MNSESHLSRQHVSSAPPGPQPDTAFSTVPEQSSMTEQAAGFAAAGRSAHASCRRGADAQQEIDARRQQSGQ